METTSLSEFPAVLDLATVEEERRAAVWSGTATSCFPGLSVAYPVTGPPLGDIRCVQMGGGSLWAIRSSPALVDYAPATIGEIWFTLMMQLDGSLTVSQRNRSCTLGAGDICLVDERFPFHMEGQGSSQIALLKMPRQVVLGRNPHLEHHTVITLRSDEPGASLVGGTLQSAIHTVPFMQERQRGAALVAIIHLLGAMDTSAREVALGWRVEAALGFIELNFAMPGLRAEEVARSQRISRRRLDQLLLESIGVSITGQIWNRRLEQAAEDLRDPLSAHRTASEIAFANGFEDPAHFTRAFKRRYGHSPLQWRNLLHGSTH